MDDIKLLSEAYKERGDTLAVCINCGSIFRDDMPQWGSLACPNCLGYALRRGVMGIEEARRILEGHD